MKRTQPTLREATDGIETVLQLDDAAAQRIGSDLASILKLRKTHKEHGGCYELTTGTKTDKGLARTVFALIAGALIELKGRGYELPVTPDKPARKRRLVAAQ